MSGGAATLPAPVDTAALRAAFGQFATGVTVITTDAGSPSGMTANSFTSLSVDPPLALVCVARGATMHESVLRAGAFGINILSAEQEPCARYFADHGRPRGRAEFDGIAWHPGPRTRAPLLTDALAWLECRLVAVHEGGDHSIFVGEVVGFAQQHGGEALVFHRGRFGRLAA